MESPELGALIFAAAGFGMLGYAVWLHFRVRQSRTWLEAPGEIIEAGKAYNYQGGFSETVGTRVTEAKVAYRYSVDGREHVGTTVCVGHEFYSSFDRQANRVLERYPVGSNVTVYYNPAKPADCCLEQRSEAIGLTALVGVFFLIMSRFM